MTASRVIAVWATTMLAGCLQGGPYACEDEAQCRRPGSAAGVCEQGWCAYDDSECASELRFSDNAGDGLAGTCVDLEATGGATQTGEGSEDPSATGSTGNDPCGGSCTSPPGPCFATPGTCADGTCAYAPRSMGSECDDDDPCSASSMCDGEGSCVANVPVVCNDPPSDCYDAMGSCDPIDGSCSYDFLDVDSPCEDGSACTDGDTCDGRGVCRAGASCATDNLCETGSCEADACVYTPMADGTSCGLVAAARCCAGTCVDISSDEANCGGCALGCQMGHTCESVANTATCEQAPADTSGRCTCAGNIDCNPGHVCRTQSPYTNLCTPETPDACPSMFIELNFCPNYCFY